MTPPAHGQRYPDERLEYPRTQHQTRHGTRLGQGARPAEVVDDPEIVHALIRRRAADARLATLTDRVRAVLAQMAQGRSNQAIARLLFMSVKTVETHISRIFAKLGVGDTSDDHRRVQAVLTFLRAIPDRGDERS